MKIVNIISVNDKGEVIADGETIYGEKHAMFLTPIEKDIFSEETHEMIEDEEKSRFNKLIDFVIAEIDYNLQPHVIEQRKYKVDALKSLCYYSGKYFLDDDLRAELDQAVDFILLCKRQISADTTPEKATKCILDLKIKIQELKKI